jgi:hypothetical protein
MTEEADQSGVQMNMTIADIVGSMKLPVAAMKMMSKAVTKIDMGRVSVDVLTTVIVTKNVVPRKTRQSTNTADVAAMTITNKENDTNIATITGKGIAIVQKRVIIVVTVIVADTIEEFSY